MAFHDGGHVLLYIINDNACVGRNVHVCVCVVVFGCARVCVHVCVCACVCA